MNGDSDGGGCSRRSEDGGCGSAGRGRGVGFAAEGLQWRKNGGCSLKLKIS